ncbi:MAG: acyloxyacyl hydrolase [Fusobacteriaceae bacterium]
MKKNILATFLILSSLAYSREIIFSGSYVDSSNNSEYQGGAFSVGIPFYHFKNPSYFLAAEPFIATDGDSLDVGALVTLIKRFDLNPKWFFDLSFGFGIMNLDNHNVLQPRGFNFTERAGVSLSYRLSEISSIGISTSVSHISNAGITDFNPGVDSYSVGIRYIRRF